MSPWGSWVLCTAQSTPTDWTDLPLGVRQGEQQGPSLGRPPPLSRRTVREEDSVISGYSAQQGWSLPESQCRGEQ